jgi:hypothetical protein
MRTHPFRWVTSKEPDTLDPPTPWAGQAARLAFLAVLLAAPLTHAASDALTNNLELIPEDMSLWRESLLWDKDIVLRAGFGYKDNVLLAPSSPIGSAFFTSGLDLTFLRLPLDGWEMNFSLVGDDVRYFHSPGGLNGEDLFLASAQVQKYFSEIWRSGLELRASYVDQVVQEIIQTGGVQAVEAKGYTLGVRPFIRRDLTTNWWVQLEAPLAREWWQSPLDSLWKLGGQAVLGFTYGPHSQLVLSGGGFYIPHDEWLARDASGTEIPGLKLVVWKQVVDLKWENQWDTQRHWSTTTRLGFNYSRDNGGGFYDYYRYYISEELHLHTRNWDAKVSGGVSYYDFPVQTIDVPPAPTLHLTTVTAGLHLDRRLYKSIRAFASFEYEQTGSDDPTSEYEVKTVAGGVSWEF